MDSNEIYSTIKVVELERMRIAKYIVISQNPEDDANIHMDTWVEKAGLLNLSNYKKRKIGWDFPFLNKEQYEKFNLHGYVTAYVIPEGFNVNNDGVEITYHEKGLYAHIRITEFDKAPWERIPTAYQKLTEYVKPGKEWAECCKLWLENGKNAFEEIIAENGINYMDVYFPMND
jgi:hypothetical protein